MKKKTRPKKVKKEKNGLLKFIFLAAFVVLLFTALFFQKQTEESILLVSNIASSTPRGSIQIGTFKNSPRGSITPTVTKPTGRTNSPTPTTNPFMCPHDTGEQIDPNACKCIALFLHCGNQICQEAKYGARKTDTGDQCQNLRGISGISDPCIGQNDGWYCYGKPIIYLYPESPMYVNVSIETSGEIFISDPLYPEGGPASPGQPKDPGGWKNILAHPSGRLEYQGKEYKELFYESNIRDLKAPLHGLTLNTKYIEKELDEVLTKLGLIGFEKQDFIEYWAPKLRELGTPYIFFSTISPSEKKRTDNVIITPKPDTFIGFIAYFKALDFPSTAPALRLPANAPKRIGFTAVEWGGTIDYATKSLKIN